jgi:phosphatidylglycerol:prolipoprotein diacylglycerol transferase
LPFSCSAQELDKAEILMYPELFSIGPLTLHSYGLFVGLGFLAALLIAMRTERSYALAPQQVLDIGFIMLISALVGSRLLYVLMNFSFYVRHPLGLLEIWHGGLVFSGGALCAIGSLIWYARRHSLSVLDLGDLWAPAAAAGQGFGRIGCFMAGCCYGKPADVPWAVVFTNPKSLAPLNVPIHPTQLYHSVSGFFLFGILMFIHRKKSYSGQVILWYLLLHSFGRLFIERFRGDDRGILFHTNMTVTQFMAVLILAGSFMALVILKTRKRAPGEE